MSGFSELERIRIAAKSLMAGVKDADATTEWYESATPNSFIIGGEKVWTSPDVDILRDNPVSNASSARTLVSGTLAGIVADFSLPANAVRLTPIPGIKNTYAALNTPGDFTSGRLENWVLPQFVIQANGQPSFGYAVRLYNGDPNNGGHEILTTDGSSGTGINKSVAWIFDYAAGILMTSETSSLFTDDPYINGFIYIGSTANDSNPNSPTVSGSGFIEFEANCPFATSVDDFVYVVGPSIGGLLQVDTVDVTNLATMPAFGIVVGKTTPSLCKVRISGEVVPANMLEPGKRYFIDSTGKPSDTIPNPSPGGKAAVQAAAYALDTNRLLLTLNNIPLVRTG